MVTDVDYIKKLRVIFKPYMERYLQATWNLPT